MTDFKITMEKMNYIQNWENKHYFLSTIVKENMISSLSLNEIIQKLKSMAAQQPVIKF